MFRVSHARSDSSNEGLLRRLRDLCDALHQSRQARVVPLEHAEVHGRRVLLAAYSKQIAPISADFVELKAKSMTTTRAVSLTHDLNLNQ